jgi:hypothetical protein
MRPAAAIVVQEAKSNLVAISLQNAYAPQTSDVYSGSLSIPSPNEKPSGFVQMQSVRNFVSNLRPRSFDCDFRTNSSTGTEHFDIYTTLKWRFGRQ